MKVLITGVNGFIGQHLTSRLIKKGHKVIGIGLEEKPRIQGLASYFKGNVLDKDIVKIATKDVNAIVHLAALTSHEKITSDKNKTMETAIIGTKNILEAFNKSKSTKFLFPSSGKVYGKVKYFPINEKHPTNPQNILGKSKLEAEKLIKSLAIKNKQYIILRIFNVYGSGQDENFLVPTVVKQIESGKSEIVLGDIKSKRDYIHIDDVIDAFILAIEQKTSPGIFIYNICTGASNSASDIVRLISKIKKRNVKIKIQSNLLRKDEFPDEYGLFELAKKELGWIPKISLEEGLRKLCKQL